jgi:hypothetical protein
MLRIAPTKYQNRLVKKVDDLRLKEWVKVKRPIIVESSSTVGIFFIRHSMFFQTP